MDTNHTLTQLYSVDDNHETPVERRPDRVWIGYDWGGYLEI
jgi:hypothetical protein